MRIQKQKTQYGGGRRIAFPPFLACILFLAIEWMNKGSFAGLCGYIAEHPCMSLMNVFLILATLLLSEPFARRRAILIAISILWLGLGATNAIMISIRVQPFTFADIAQVKDGIALITVYFHWYQILLIFVGGFLAIAGIVLLFAKCKREVPRRARGLILAIGAVMGYMLVYTLCVRAGYLPRRFDNLVEAYRKYGFAVCFANSVSQSGIDEPKEYSDTTVDALLDDLEETSEVIPEDVQPNIIFVQLESFFDVNTLRDTRFSENPIPNFTELMEKYPSGSLYVPSVGGGTANTEFEVLTGMCLDFFGAGEYPYNSVLRETTCETICYNLAECGYTSMALHNYTGTFYGRNTVYAQLGFQNFISLEYMQGAEYNALGWCMDSVLVPEICKALDSTDSQDFLFTITVETHGRYPDEPLEDADLIEVLSAPEEIYVGQLHNYVNYLHGTDEFIGELLDALNARNEPTVVVFYGDHLPAIGLQDAMLPEGNLYATQYVIWNNYGEEFFAEDIEAYQLASEVLTQLGIEGGVLCQYHRTASEKTEEEYLEGLELLEYDVLYGEQEAYDEKNPYENTHTVLGCVPITISDVDMRYGRVLVRGENFNEFSKIVLDDKALETLYVDAHTLVAACESNEGHVCVAQYAIETGAELSRTGEWNVEYTKQ